ncbi:MAG: hypothetical protein R2771_09395 [Saprospiraceae bacterium]
MKKIIYLIGIILVIALSIIYSCNKEDALNVEDTSLMFRIEYNIDFPTVNGDRYVFRDFDHLTSYYHSMEEILDTNQDLFESIVDYEGSLMTIQKKLINDSFETPESRFITFLGDPIMRSVLNENYEFEINNVLVTYMNNRDLLICDPNDGVTQSEIRNLPKGGTLDFSTIPKGAYWGDDTNSESLAPWCGCQVHIERHCEQIHIWGTCKNAIWGDGGGTVTLTATIQTDIGPLNYNKSWDVDGNFEFYINYPFTFSRDIVTFLVQAQGDCSNRRPDEKYLVYDPKVNNSCDSNERSIEGWYENASGTEGYTHKTSYYQNFWAYYSKAEMTSKHKVGGIWKKNRAPLHVKIEEYRNNFECKPAGNEYDIDKCKNCKSISVRVSTGFLPDSDEHAVYHCDGDVIGYYDKTVNGVNLHAEGIIDFDCCEN